MIAPGEDLGHLVELLFRGKGGTRPLAFLEAYGDETGLHDRAELFCFGGLVGPADDWLAMQKLWKTAMSRAGLDPEKVAFHMTDCVGAEGFGAFRDIPYETRTALIDELVSILVSAQCFGRSIEINRGKPDSRVTLSNWPAVDPYQWAFSPFLKLICESAEAFLDAEEEISFIFDLQKEWHSVGQTLYAQTKEAGFSYSRRLGPIAYGSGLRFIPLQAADLVTWELSHESARVINKTRPQPRRTYSRLENTGRIDRYEWREDNLNQHVDSVRQMWRETYGEGVIPVRVGRPGSPIKLERLPKGMRLP